MRDMAEQMGYPKPALICSKFLVGLEGISSKASSTAKIPPIFLNDGSLTIINKIKRYAFSGGRETLKEHREKGGDLAVDVPYIYLYHFLQDDVELMNIAGQYASGKMMTSEIKKIVSDLLIKIIDQHQKIRNEITPELYQKYFTMFVQPKVKDTFAEYCEKYIDINIIS